MAFVSVARLVLCASVVTAASSTPLAACDGLYEGTPLETPVDVPTEEEFIVAMKALDVDALKEDMTKLLTESNPCWPADYGNYVGLFSRLSWHAAGTFRESDGVGGAGGGRMRFDPEASWPDNTNLDKARALLAPIKRKYGAGLSWGDLIALAGTHAMWHQGMPFKQFCFGRLDDPDGNKSLPLGPSTVQEADAPCTGEQGDCQARANETALAPTTVGLIYVNPEGPMANPVPAESAKEIRLVFGKMGHDDRATVALVGGGHAFGKTHGACSDKEVTNPAGLPPDEAREANEYPWVGRCSEGTFTSGFEGAWTSTPTRWSNQFFTMLLDTEWEMWEGPGGHIQWRVKDQPDDPRMRLTADLALVADDEYKKWVELFASNITALEEAFDEAWDALMTNGGSWSSKQRCVGFGPPPMSPVGPSQPQNEEPRDENQVSRAGTWAVKQMVIAVAALGLDFALHCAEE